jgi:hypothetical protein
MGRVVADIEAMTQLLLSEIVAGFEEIGLEVKRFVQGNTPVRTGYARRSVWYAVIDERGNVIGGDSTDENGVAIGNYLPRLARGSLHVVIGANASYYIWIEIGARGRAGKQALARGSELLDARMRQWYAENRRAA